MKSGVSENEWERVMQRNVRGEQASEHVKLFKN